MRKLSAVSLTAICYILIPKSGNPSLAEVMDGTLHKKLIEAKAPELFLKTYDREFVTTVLLVNEGPECNGFTNLSALNNTKVRVDCYNYFVGTEDLLRIPPSIQVDTSPVTDSEWSLIDNYSSCVSMLVGKLNNLNGSESYQKLFARPYYFKYKPNWDGDKNVNVPDIYDSGIQIFGGTKIKDLLKKK